MKIPQLYLKCANCETSGCLESHGDDEFRPGYAEPFTDGGWNDEHPVRVGITLDMAFLLPVGWVIGEDGFLCPRCQTPAREAARA